MFITISEAAILLGVTPKSLRDWERKKLLQADRTPGKHRRYEMHGLLNFYKNAAYFPEIRRKTQRAAIYSRVSSAKQKHDLLRQRDFLIQKVITDGSRFIKNV